MDQKMKELQEENKKWNELEQVKNKINTATVHLVILTFNRKEANMQTPSFVSAENRRK